MLSTRAWFAAVLLAAIALPAGTAHAATTTTPTTTSIDTSSATVRPTGTYDYLCYTPLQRLKTLRPSPTRTYSYDALTLQDALVYLDFPPPVPIKLDGWYGPATAAAVKAYQRSRQLYVDGVVGQQTWRQLRSEIC